MNDMLYTTGDDGCNRSTVNTPPIVIVPLPIATLDRVPSPDILHLSNPVPVTRVHWYSTS